MHRHPNFAWFRAVGVMIGATVGVGVFGMPYAFAQSGFVIGLLTLLVMGALMLVLQLMIAEMALQTPGHHRLIGYMRRYLGERGKHLASFLFFVYGWGAMVAFLIFGGTFLHALFDPLFGGELWMYQIAVIPLVGAITMRGLNKFVKIESFVVLGFLVLFAAITVTTLPAIEWTNILPIHPEAWFVPYGVVLFSLSGIGAVPEMKDVLGRGQLRALPHTVWIGQTIIVLLYALFAFAVVGTTGEGTTAAALDGLMSLFGPSFATVASLLGALTAISIFSLLTMQIQSTLRFDYHFSLRSAWLVTLGVPLLLFFMGVREFVELIGFLGGVFGGILGMLIVISYERMRRSSVCLLHHCLNIPHVVSYVLMAVFFSGIVLTVTQTFF